MKKCFICDLELADDFVKRVNNQPIYSVQCDNCGLYKISDLLALTISKDHKNAIKWYIGNHNDCLFYADNIDFIEQEFRRFNQVKQD